MSEWRLSLEFSCFQQILGYPATEYNGSLCKEGCLRPLHLIPWGKINFTCCVQGKWNSPTSPPKGAKDADVLTCGSDFLILPEVQVHPPVFLCIVLAPPGPTSCFTGHLFLVLPCSLFHAPFMAVAKGCYVMRSLCALITGKNSSMSRFLCNFHLVPKSSLWSTQVSALN